MPSAMRNAAARACSATTRIETSFASSAPYVDPVRASSLRMSGRKRSVLNVSVTPAVVLLEDEVPDLQVSSAALPGVALVLGNARLRTLVDEHLAVRSAEAGRPRRPEVALVAEPEDFLRRKERERLRPDLVGLVVARVHGRDELRAVEAEDLREQVPAPGDRFFLPVVADPEIAEHLEERLVVAVLADLFDVGRAEHLLDRDDALRRRLLGPQEVGHERLHPGAREEDARVVL